MKPPIRFTNSHKNVASTAEQDPLSDEYVNAVIRQHGYDSPETVIARLWQWIGLNGGENSETLLIYEAHKALSKLRAPVAEGQFKAAFPNGALSAAKYHELWERASKTGNTTYTRLENMSWHIAQFGELVAKEVAASAPVAGEAQPAAYLTLDDEGSPNMLFFDLVEARKYCEPEEDPEPLFRHAAPQASEAVRTEALYLLREARALLPAFTTAEAIGEWSEKVNQFAAGSVIDVPPQADKDGAVCSCPTGDGSLRWPCAVHPPPPRDSAKSARDEREPSPTAGMKLGQRIAHVGGRTNAQGYIEFGSPMAVNALIQQVLRDLPDRQQRAGDLNERAIPNPPSSA